MPLYPRLQELREDNDLTQKEIAKLLFITQQQYSLYERGHREIPLSMIMILAKHYKTSIDYIVGLTNESLPYR